MRPNEARPLRVFLVEDSEVLARLLVETISELPGLAVVGRSGLESEALQLTAEMLPEVIVLDIQLKEGNGISLLKQLRARAVQPRPRIYILTNHASPEYRKLGALFGADDFFDKSAELPLLCETLAGLSVS